VKRLLMLCKGCTKDADAAAAVQRMLLLCNYCCCCTQAAAVVQRLLLLCKHVQSHLLLLLLCKV